MLHQRFRMKKRRRGRLKFELTISNLLRQLVSSFRNNICRVYAGDSPPLYDLVPLGVKHGDLNLWPWSKFLPQIPALIFLSLWSCYGFQDLFCYELWVEGIKGLLPKQLEKQQKKAAHREPAVQVAGCYCCHRKEANWRSKDDCTCKGRPDVVRLLVPGSLSSVGIGFRKVNQVILFVFVR